MRQLQFVGVSDDGAHLMLQDAANVREQFLLPIDERLRAASRGDRSRLGQIEIELDSTHLRPREIQARIRAGETPEEVAAAAGAPLQRVMRFAYPVLQEREQVTVEARRTRIRRSEGALMLGEQVDERLGRQGVDPDSTSWDAHRREDGTWWLSLSWQVGKTPRRAQWSFDLAGRTLTPADDLAAELQADQPRRRTIAAVPFVPDEEPEDEEPEPAPVRRPEPTRTETNGHVEEYERTSRAEPVERSVQSERTMQPERTMQSERSQRPERSGRTEERQTHPAPTRRTERDEPAAIRRAPAKAAAPRPRTEPIGWAAPKGHQTERRRATPAKQPPEPVTESAPAVETVTEPERPQNERPAETPVKSGKKGKPKVPSWDDIVFGTRGQR